MRIKFQGMKVVVVAIVVEGVMAIVVVIVMVDVDVDVDVEEGNYGDDCGGRDDGDTCCPVILSRAVSWCALPWRAKTSFVLLMAHVS